MQSMNRKKKNTNEKWKEINYDQDINWLDFVQNNKDNCYGVC